MTERYYYTDPLEAAYMAKNFGMYFRDVKDRPLSLVDQSETWGRPRWYVTKQKRDYRYNGLFYDIYPDSLHILEPREGDVAIGKFGDYFRYSATCDKKTEFYFNAMDIYRNQPEEEDLPLRIVLRDGKPFFWPEKEVA